MTTNEVVLAFIIAVPLVFLAYTYIKRRKDRKADRPPVVGGGTSNSEFRDRKRNLK